MSQKARYTPLGSSPRSDEDDESEEEELDESEETSLVALGVVLGLHFFATALTVPALPSLLLEILGGSL